MTSRQRMSLLVGAVGTSLLFLSVWHLTCGIAELTKTPVFLSLLLGIGIDLGLVATEFAELVATEDLNVGRWARRYMVAATVLSAVINSYEFYARAPEGIGRVLAVVFGVAVPCFVFALGKVSGHLWNGEAKCQKEQTSSRTSRTILIPKRRVGVSHSSAKVEKAIS